MTYHNEITEVTDDKITEINTYKNTDELTEYKTDKITEFKTDELTEYKTDELTEYKTDKITEFKTDEITENIKKTDKIEEETQNKERTCSDEDILSNNCKNGIVLENQMNRINNEIKEEYLKDEYNGENNIIKTENVIFQVTTLNNQTDSNYKDLSLIDLGECSQKLKDFYKIPEKESLIVYKTDIKTSNYVQTYVQYEIYNPLNLDRLDLSICENTKITINTKINLDNSTISLYDNLKESGYDLFNKSDPFYTDVCSIYTSENGTDLTLLDRNTEIFEKNGNISLCQTGCKLSYFNSKTKEIKCECTPKLMK